MKNAREMGSLEMTLCECRSLGDAAPARHLLQLFPRLGFTFLWSRPSTIDTNPERHIKETGSIIVPLQCSHPLLGRDAYAIARESVIGFARLSFMIDSRAVLLHQTVHPNGENTEELVRGQVAVLKHIYGDLRPTYGWIDECGENALPRKFNSLNEVKFLFWANLFGPALTQELGESFLANSPAFSIEKLDDGGCLVLSTETFEQWFHDPPGHIRDYFAAKIPGLRTFRARRFKG